MKKLIIFLPILFLFLSCQNMIYTKVETEKITSKTSMQPFDHLNDPMVVCYSYCVTKGLFGNENMFSQYETLGTIFIVYDWENEEFFDWAFTPELKGWSNDRGAELGTPKKYYSSEFYSEKVVELNPETGEFTIYEAPMANMILTMNTSNFSSDYGLRSFQTNINGQEYWQYYIFDTKTGKTNETPIQMPADNINTFYPMPDEKGVYWFSYSYQQKNYLISVDCTQENLLSEPFFINDIDVWGKEMGAILATDKYIVLGHFQAENIEPYCYVYRKSDKQILTIPIEYKFDDNYPFVYYAVNCCGTDYILSYIGLNNYIYSIDYDNLKLIPESENVFNYNNSVYVRDSKIIFLNTNVRDGFEIHFYDTKNKSWSIGKKYTIESIINSK